MQRGVAPAAAARLVECAALHRAASPTAPTHPSTPCAETTWQLLEKAIGEINNHNASGLSFEELYR